MSRTVIIGDSATRPYKLTSADLPADFDLSNSFWKWVDFSQRTGGNPSQRFDGDLSAYDMTDMDIIECTANNVTLGAGKTSHLMSRNTNWSGTLPTTDISSYNHDLMAEVYRSASNASHPVIQRALELVTATYRNSWSNMIYTLIQEFGETELFAQGFIAFAPYPQLVSRLEHHQRGRLWDDQPINMTRTVIKFEGQERDVQAQLVGHEDRWATARMIEQFLDIPCYVAMLIPDAVILTPPSRDEAQRDSRWYVRAWPIG